MIKLVAVDMDGTLLNSRKELPEELFAAVGQLKKRGVKFVAASGRQYYNLRKLLSTVADDIAFICENGAIVFDGGTNLFVSEIKRDELWDPVADIRKQNQVKVVLAGLDSAYIEDSDPEFVADVTKYYEHLKIVPDVMAASREDRICKIAAYEAVDAEQNSYRYLQKYSGNFKVCLSGDKWVDLMNPGVNKGAALKLLQRRQDADGGETMAFGDYLNDYEMMKECFHSYAMENAHEDLKRICRFRAKSNDENGVVDALCREFQLVLQ